MILLLDIGNTRLKWARWDGAALVPGTPLDHAGQPALAVRALPGAAPQAIWIAQVLGAEHAQPLELALHARFGRIPHFAASEAQRAGLRNAYAEPQRLGIDRWLMMLALWQELHGPFCVAGAGTALTLDAVDPDGGHRGGFIAAGLSTHVEAVLGATRFATRGLSSAYATGLGTDTESCVQQGALLACLGAIDRGWYAAGAPPKKFISGGDAERLLPFLSHGWMHRPLLVLEGLLVLARAGESTTS